MHTLRDEIKLASDTTKYRVEVFDGSMTIIVPLGSRSVSQVAARLGLIPRDTRVTGDVRGWAKDQFVIITTDPSPYFRDAERTGGKVVSL